MQSETKPKTTVYSRHCVKKCTNATMFSHLLPGCSCGSKHLLLPLVPYILAVINLLHDFLYNVSEMQSETKPKTTVYSVDIA